MTSIFKMYQWRARGKASCHNDIEGSRRFGSCMLLNDLLGLSLPSLSEPHCSPVPQRCSLVTGPSTDSFLCLYSHGYHVFPLLIFAQMSATQWKLTISNLLKITTSLPALLTSLASICFRVFINFYWNSYFQLPWQQKFIYIFSTNKCQKQMQYLVNSRHLV